MPTEFDRTKYKYLRVLRKQTYLGTICHCAEVRNIHHEYSTLLSADAAADTISSRTLTACWHCSQQRTVVISLSVKVFGLLLLMPYSNDDDVFIDRSILIIDGAHYLLFPINWYNIENTCIKYWTRFHTPIGLSNCNSYSLCPQHCKSSWLGTLKAQEQKNKMQLERETMGCQEWEDSRRG